MDRTWKSPCRDVSDLRWWEENRTAAMKHVRELNSSGTVLRRSCKVPRGGVQWRPPWAPSSRTLVNVTLRQKGLGRVTNPSWIIQVGPECNHQRPYKRRAGWQTTEQEAARCGGSRHWSGELWRRREGLQDSAATRSWGAGLDLPRDPRRNDLWHTLSSAQWHWLWTSASRTVREYTWGVLSL